MTVKSIERLQYEERKTKKRTTIVLGKKFRGHAVATIKTDQSDLSKFYIKFASGAKTTVSFSITKYRCTYCKVIACDP